MRSAKRSADWRSLRNATSRCTILVPVTSRLAPVPAPAGPCLRLGPKFLQCLLQQCGLIANPALDQFNDLGGHMSRGGIVDDLELQGLARSFERSRHVAYHLRFKCLVGEKPKDLQSAVSLVGRRDERFCKRRHRGSDYGGSAGRPIAGASQPACASHVQMMTLKIRRRNPALSILTTYEWRAPPAPLGALSTL